MVLFIGYKYTAEANSHEDLEFALLLRSGLFSFLNARDSVPDYVHTLCISLQSLKCIIPCCQKCREYL